MTIQTLDVGMVICSPYQHLEAQHKILEPGN
jgi:hypothetical protein